MAERLADPAEVRAHLIGAARAGTALTYAELLERLGYHFSRPKMRQLCVVLGDVDRDSEARGEPELAVLVVRPERRHSRPGLVGGRGRRQSGLLKGRGKARGGALHPRRAGRNLRFLAVRMGQSPNGASVKPFPLTIDRRFRA